MAELGVLFIHGVGRQRRTQTLDRCARPLCRAISRWVASADPAGSVLVRPGLQDGYDRTPQPTPDARDRQAPASVNLAINVRDDYGQARHRWLLAESCWADRRIAPVIWHSLNRAQYAVFCLLKYIKAEIGIRCRRAASGPTPPDGTQLIGAEAPRARDLAGGRVEDPWRLPRSDMAPLGRGFASRLRDAGRFCQSWLVMSIGDVLVRRRDRARWATIVSHVEADMNWLSMRCDRVALIAHSHGAVIARDVLSRREPGNIALLITYGAVGSMPRRHAAGRTHVPGRRKGRSVVRSLDFAAGSDPFVARQPTATAAGQGIRIRNQGSFLTAHWAYWRNIEEFVLPIVTALMDAESCPPSLNPPREFG